MFNGNPVTTLTGVGPTADGFTPPSGYANTLLNSSYFITSSGRLFIFVVQGGGGYRALILTVWTFMRWCRSLPA
jgi:hypothetical protein